MLYPKTNEFKNAIERGRLGCQTVEDRVAIREWLNTVKVSDDEFYDAINKMVCDMVYKENNE